MATKNIRYWGTVDNKLADCLKELSKQAGKSIPVIIRELIQEALELRRKKHEP